MLLVTLYYTVFKIKLKLPEGMFRLLYVFVLYTLVVSSVDIRFFVSVRMFFNTQSISSVNVSCKCLCFYVTF